MFGLFKSDPVKKLEKKYALLMEKAMTIQRSGDLKHYARLMEEGEKLEAEIIELKSRVEK